MSNWSVKTNRPLRTIGHRPTVPGGPSITPKGRNSNSRANRGRIKPPKRIVKTIINAKTDGTGNIRVKPDPSGIGTPASAIPREMQTATNPVSSLSFYIIIIIIKYAYELLLL